MSIFNYESAKKAAENHSNVSTQMTQMFIKRLEHKKSQVLMEGLLYRMTSTFDSDSSVDKNEVKDMLENSKMMCTKLENVISALQELQIAEEEEKRMILAMMEKHEEEIAAFEEAHPDIADKFRNEEDSD